MSTIIAIIEAGSDGTLHMPVPDELRRGKVLVEADRRNTMEPRPSRAAIDA